MADSDPIQPQVIWLSPFCVGCDRHAWGIENGQLWCTKPQDDCAECGLGWTRYTLDAEQAAEARAQQRPPADPSER